MKCNVCFRRIKGDNSKHNDRTSKKLGSHIDKEKSENNEVWSIGNNDTFREDEIEFYEEKFRKRLDKMNQKYIDGRKPKFVKTMVEYHDNKNSKPEDFLMYLGSKEEFIEKKELYMECLDAYTEWHEKQFPQIQIMNAALHTDEGGAYHIQARQVYIAYDEDGDAFVQQNKCLEQMGIERPWTDKPQDKWNNAKMTYTRMCQEKWREIAHKKGLNVEYDQDKHIDFTKERQYDEEGRMVTSKHKSLEVWQQEKDLEKAKEKTKEQEKEYQFYSNKTQEEKDTLRDLIQQHKIAEQLGEKDEWMILADKVFDLPVGNPLKTELEQLLREYKLIEFDK